MQFSIRYADLGLVFWVFLLMASTKTFKQVLVQTAVIVMIRIYHDGLRFRV